MASQESVAASILKEKIILGYKITALSAHPFARSSLLASSPGSTVDATNTNFKDEIGISSSPLPSSFGIVSLLLRIEINKIRAAPPSPLSWGKNVEKEDAVLFLLFSLYI